MKRPILFLLLISLSFSACVETTWETKQYDSGITLEVPDYLKETKQLKPDAIVQLENVNRELYFILDQQSKNTVLEAGVEFDLNAFSRELMNTMMESLSKVVMEDKGPVKCGELNAYEFSVAGKPKVARSIAYQVLVVEGTQHFYILTCWTSTGSQTSWFTEDMHRMMMSFRINN